MLEKKPLIAKRVVLNKQGEIVSLLDGSTGKVFITNHVGEVVLRLCDGKRSTKDIIFELTKVYRDQPVKRLTEDVTRFLSESEQRGLITWIL